MFGEKGAPVPTRKVTGILFPVYSISPVDPVGIVYNKSDREYTSIYPPTPSTLMLVPKVCPNGTEGDPVDLIGVIGCLYKLIYLCHNLFMVECRYL
jgi:hypothetical protein